MKGEYLAPVMEIILYNEDVIRTSTAIDGDDNLIYWPGFEESDDE